MKFQKITDTQWDVTRRHLPRPARTGRPRADDRKTLDAIMYVCVTGIRWIDHLPERYGPESTAHRRLQDWQKAGVWKKILGAATVKAAHNNNDKIDDGVNSKVIPDNTVKAIRLLTATPEISVIEEYWYQSKRDVLVTEYYHATVMRLAVSKYFRTVRSELDAMRFICRKTFDLKNF